MTNLYVDPVGCKLLVQMAYHPEALETILKFSGRVWRKPYWTFPLSPEIVADVEKALAKYGPVRKDQKLVDFLENKKTEHRQILDWKQESGTLELLPGTQFHIKPFKHQETGLAFCQRRPAFALFMEMGTGKTKIIVDLLGNAYRWNPSLSPTVVVVPLAVLNNWPREVAAHQPHLRVVVAQGSPAAKKKAVDQAKQGLADIVVITYESLWRMVDQFNFDLFAMVLDESTKIKHRATKQAKAIMKVGQRASRRYIMTGTPSPNNPMELFNQIKFLDASVFGSSWYAFRDRYAIMGGYGGYEILGWKNLPELTQKLAGISYRVLKKDCLDLPEKIYKEYRLPMAADQARVYKELATDLITTVKDTEIIATVVLAKLTKLRQLASGFVYRPDGTAVPLESNPKLTQLRELLVDICRDHKVVIWTTFREEVNLISALCHELGLKWVKYDGSIQGKKRQEIVEDFQRPGSETKVFIGQQHAGGIGITLTAADYCVFFSNDYSSEIRLQAEDRLHRIGQRNPVTYIDIILKGTIDSTIKYMLQKKANLAESLLPTRIEKLIYAEEF